MEESGARVCGRVKSRCFLESRRDGEDCSSPGRGLTWGFTRSPGHVEVFQVLRLAQRVDVDKSGEGPMGGDGAGGEPAEPESWGPRKKRFQRHRCQMLGPLRTDK